MRKSPLVTQELEAIQARLRACRKCLTVCDTPVHGPAIAAQVLVLGQAPGVHEARLGRPFAHTAGKTLFQWLHRATGANERDLRELFYFSAVTRCFPGKAKSGAGDRPPSPEERANCEEHLAAEVQTLRPRLVVAVGRFAIAAALRREGFTGSSKLTDVVGKIFQTRFHGESVKVIPLPHPSGVSRWHQTPGGKIQLHLGLKILSREFQKLTRSGFH